MKSKIHINRHNIRANKKLGNIDKPVFTVKTYKDNRKGWEVEILCDPPVKLVYNPDKSLSCGAVAWVETEAEVEVK